MATASARSSARLKAVKAASGRGRPVKGANFVPKRQRKAARKKLVREYSIHGWAANKVDEVKAGARARADFVRNLREVKVRRRKIAAEMAALADMVSGLYRETNRIGDRVRDVDSGYLNEALMTVKAASASVGAVADEFHVFSRARVWYTEVAA
jgi:hypothetical protein